MPSRVVDPLMIEDEAAVRLHNVSKSYRVRYNRWELVIRGLNMAVKKGSVYGLLGPSGCGKTTLFRCMVGTVSVDKGQVIVFGRPPASKGSGIPGPQVGYMPQEVALYEELSISETWRYYGFIAGMSTQHIHDRIQFMASFLELEPTDRFVQCLSGGQRRRVSFATALLHQPPLLILDEPTVGVDPLLRNKIWDHLTGLVRSCQTTIIISTHYIEEARAVDTVGMMSKGEMLVEASPEHLLKSYCATTLEQVFFRLCLKQEHSNDDEQEMKQLNGHSAVPLTVVDNGPLDHNGPPEAEARPKRSWFALKRLLATTTKNLLKFYRNPGVLIFAIIIPAIQMIIAVMAMGGQFTHLPLAIVNEDSKDLGQRFVNHLDEQTIRKVAYGSYEDGAASVRSGLSYGVIHIGENFTDSLMARFSHGLLTDNEDIIDSTINVSLDLTNIQVALALKHTLLTSFDRFAKSSLERNGLNPMALSIPLQWAEHVYGEESQPLSHFVCPGLMISIAYFMAMGLMSLTFVMERTSGQWDRGTVAGITPVDHVIAHMLAHILVVILQIVFMFVVAFAIFDIPSRGSYCLAFVLVLLQGLCGMAHGVVVGAICRQENTAVMLVIGFFYPCVVLNGGLWPLESLPQYLYYLSLSLPQTYPTQALRSIIAKGWNLAYPPVYIGFGVTISWLLIYIVFATIVLKLKQ